MTATETNRTRGETFVIAKTTDGYRVCSPLTPATQYVVTGIPDNPQCTCQEFQNQQGDSEYACPHTLAVLEAGVPAPNAPAQNGGAPARNGNGQGGTLPPPVPVEKKPAGGRNGNGAVMTMKRSVSPDGHVDSFSVEFSYPVGRHSTEELKAKAQGILAIQGEIAGHFVATTRRAVPPSNGNGANGQPYNGTGGAPVPPTSSGNGGAPCNGQLLGVASMPGKFGRRLFLNVLVNSQVLKFFGGQKQLAEAVVAAGYPGVAGNLVDGYNLNLPCRVVTKPSPDGKYTNVDRLLPVAAATPTSGGQGQ